MQAGCFDCDDTMARLSRYVDRELTDDEASLVQTHLKGCPPCGSVFDFQTEMKRLVRKECCADDAPSRLREWVRRLAAQETKQIG
jgi:mycothiol system anti-sigma-R factor